MIDGFISVGATAMTGFFLLSGFVMQRIYGGQDLTVFSSFRRFMCKRLAAIWPCYLLVAITISLIKLCFKYDMSVDMFLECILLAPLDFLGISMFYSPIFFKMHHSGTWFISCIFIAYLLFPYISRLIRGMSWRYKILTFFVFVFVSLWSQVVVALVGLSDVYASPFARFIEFCVGVFLAELSSSGMVSTFVFHYRKSLILIGSGIYVIGTELLIRYSVFPCDAYMSYSAVVLPLLIMLIAGASVVDIKFDKLNCILEKLGAVSYTFFLGQFFCFDIVRRFSIFAKATACEQFLMAFVLCAGISLLLYEGIQKPCKRYLLKEMKND